LIKEIDVTEGLKKKGIVIINTNKPKGKLGIKGFEVHTVDASSVALKLFKKQKND
jgi:hypothetical protein